MKSVNGETAVVAWQSLGEVVMGFTAYTGADILYGRFFPNHSDQPIQFIFMVWVEV